MCLRFKVMLPVVCVPDLLPRVSLEWSEVKELVPRSVSTAGPLTVTCIRTGPEQHLRTASWHALQSSHNQQHSQLYIQKSHWRLKREKQHRILPMEQLRKTQGYTHGAIEDEGGGLTGVLAAHSPLTASLHSVHATTLRIILPVGRQACCHQ